MDYNDASAHRAATNVIKALPDMSAADRENYLSELRGMAAHGNTVAIEYLVSIDDKGGNAKDKLMSELTTELDRFEREKAAAIRRHKKDKTND